MIGRTLSHYRITALLGKGGMGEVYRARDLRLQRDVALKVLPPEFSRDADRRARFEREARALAALSHPNTVAIFDYGVEGDAAFAVMELLEGEDLARTLTRGPLPRERAVEVAAAVAAGLAAAHAAGILHRDLKPANIFLGAGGAVKLLDFGLAKRVLEADSAEDPQGETAAMTVAGTVLGTPAYMAPERLLGGAGDGRSDLFALGVILHEMLAGRGPFDRGSAAATVQAILRDAPPTVDGLDPTLTALLQQCLEKDPAKRPGSAEEVERRLRSAPAPAGPPVDDAVDSLAVLPFHNQAGDEEMDYLIDGLADALIDSLGRLPRLKIMARSTVLRCADRFDRPEEVGRELKVRAVLTGRLQQRGDQLLIAAELVDARDGSRLWGRRMRRPRGDLLAVEDEICREIASNLSFQLSAEEKDRLARRPTESAEAHEAYRKGRSVWNRWKTAEAMRTAIGFFERALELDPLYAQAYAGLADSYSILGNVKALPPGEAYPKARTAALQGLVIDDQVAELHASLGFIQRHWEWAWEDARRSLQRAVELNPGYAIAHRFYGHLLCGLGEHEAAIERVRRALELDPLSPLLHTSLGDTYFYARRYDEAMEWYRKCIELDEGFLPGHTDLARALELAGRYEEALEEFRIAEALAQKGPLEPSSGRAHVYAAMGRHDEARAIVDQLLALAPGRYVSPYGIASIHACMGEVDTALDWLEKAFEEHDQTLVWLKVHPRLDPVRGTARYRRLLEKMGLAG